jgi:ribosome maturation factor RimP
MSQQAAAIAALLAPTVKALGLELLGVEFRTGSGLLRVYIDVSEAEAPVRVVNVDDCERVSREVSALLDVEDPIPGHYTLEVSSPGLDRPLFTGAQFARFVGMQAKLQLHLPQDGRRRLQGRIMHADDTIVTLAPEGAEPVAIGIDNIEQARLLPDWAALGYAPKPQPGHGPAARKPTKPTNKPKA